MGKEQRLTRPGEFQAVYQSGKSWGNRILVLRALPNEREVTRLGLAVSKRVGGAVVRNRVKRRLREVSRAAPLEPGWDVVIVARPPAAGADYRELESAFRELAKKAKLCAGGNAS